MPDHRPCDRRYCKGRMTPWAESNEADGLRRFFVCDMDSKHIVDVLVTDERQDALPGMEGT